MEEFGGAVHKSKARRRGSELIAETAIESEGGSAQLRLALTPWR